MARGKSRSGPAPAPARSAPPQQTHHHYSSQQSPPPAAHHAPPPPAPSSGGGMGFGSMLAQGAALGAGSAVGHMAVGGIANMFSGSGGGHSQPAPVNAAPPPTPSATPSACQELDQSFHRCMENNNNDMNVCGYVFNELTSCKRQFA
eukprot:Sspe_Gene.39002::Locus_18822_Transcript_1_1_Confidence_1.000_Length_690::g.39002::m.39002